MTDTAARARIWYQSFVDPVAQAPYVDRLRARLQRLAAPGVTVDVHGMTPPDRHFHALTEFRCADQAIRAALTAEKEGYDAFVMGHFQEPGLTEMRGSVDIPVVSLGEATLHFACTLGRRIGLVTINPVFVPWHEEQVRRHGLESRIAGVAAIEADLARFMRAFEDPAAQGAVRADFVARVAPLIARGADVIIPAGGIPMLLFAEQQPFLIEGTLVLEGIATVLEAAEMAVAMRRATGVVAARSGLYARASAGAIADFMAPRGG